MKRYILLSLLLVITFICYSQEINYQIDKPQQVFIGTPINIFVELTMEPGDSVYSAAADSLDVFLLKGDVFQTEEIIDNKKKINQKLTYQPFNTGEYTFPPLEYAVKTDTGMKLLTTSEFQVNVQSALPDSAQAIKDIADPVSIRLTFLDFAIPILIIIILILLIRYLIRYLKQAKEMETGPVIPTDTRPAWQIALELVQKLKSSDILDKGDFIQYHFRLSLILRYFLELEYKLKAVEMTTSEIRTQLVLSDHKEKSAILDFLAKSDRIKFAKYPVDRAQTYSAVDWLEKYFISYKNKTAESKQEENNV